MGGEPVSEFSLFEPPPHGADLESASARYRIPASDWLDLSAAINPHAYPVAAMPADALRSLPYSLRDAQEAAQHYCAASVLPIFAAGSQTVIQWLPFVHRALQAGRRVAVPRIGYAEHAFRWQLAGYDIVAYDPRAPETVDVLLQRDAIDVLVAINPHNPLSHTVAPRRLLQWHAALQRNSGWLIVDEAFVDAVPQNSLSGMADMPGMVVLRSLGKFFGLAGVRCGYAFCHPSIGVPLATAIGPWPLSSLAIAAATQALRDESWQQAARVKLTQWSSRNAELLMRTLRLNGASLFTHPLFNSAVLPLSLAVHIEEHLAQRAIRVRRIELDHDTALLRFGLVDPADEKNWICLKVAINQFF